MIWLLILMWLVGIFLSAFFSGTETGFFRVTRVRLMLDGLGGDPFARALLWLTNNPALFVATTLIGNNLANYITSLAVVLGAESFSEESHLVQLLAPIVLAPLVFVYGELLPKSLFYDAPNLLLRRSGPLFLLCAILFAPFAALLWAMGRLLQWLLGESPERLRLTLARRELARVLEEGHEAGILWPSQRSLAQGLFAVASQPVTRFCVPAARMTAVRLGMPKAEVLRLARRHRVAAVPVEEVAGRRRTVGYVRVVDLCLDKQDSLNSIRPLLEIPETETHIAALIRMQSANELMAKVVDQQGQTVGLVTAQRLTEPLFRGV